MCIRDSASPSLPLPPLSLILSPFSPLSSPLTSLAGLMGLRRTPCLVSYPTALRTHYAMPGTDIAYAAATRLQPLQYALVLGPSPTSRKYRATRSTVLPWY
eukprot:2893429-Rhodomonas_salina.1